MPQKCLGFQHNYDIPAEYLAPQIADPTRFRTRFIYVPVCRQCLCDWYDGCDFGPHEAPPPAALHSGKYTNSHPSTLAEVL